MSPNIQLNTDLSRQAAPARLAARYTWGKDAGNRDSTARLDLRRLAS